MREGLVSPPRLEPRNLHRSTALRTYIPFAVALMDASLLYSAFVLAYWLRYDLRVGPHIQDSTKFLDYLPVSFLLLATMMAVLFFKGAYRTRLGTEIVDEFATVFSSATISVASVVVITAMLNKYQYSRGVILYVWVLAIILLWVGRGLFRALLSALHRRGIGASRVLVVGATDAAKIVMQNMTSRPDLGYQLVGFVDHERTPHVKDFGRFRALGTVADMPELLGQGVDEVILALPAAAHEEVWPILSLCQQHGVGLKIVPDLFEMSLSHVRVDDIAGIPLLDVREPPLRRMARAAKRILDIAVAAVGMVISLPILLLLALFIRLESRGPAFLKQERVGLRGKRFTCLKLRTMEWDAEDQHDTLVHLNEARGPIFKMRDDPRRTKVGRRIRRLSLDELPQLWNILRGDMSLVGPRPPLPREVDQYESWQHRRLDVKPGLTGVWQVSGRSDLPFDEMIMMDIYYVDNWSLSLDIRIMLSTIFPVLSRRGAY
jgi:exopolysaccharide biosynthesis polyprenyl glycosylphosphotransferase